MSRRRGLTRDYQCTDTTLKGILKCLNKNTNRSDRSNEIVRRFLEQDDDFLRDTTDSRSITSLFKYYSRRFRDEDSIGYLKIMDRLIDLDIIKPNQVYPVHGWAAEVNPIMTPFSAFLWVNPVWEEDPEYNKLALKVFYKFIEKGGLFVLTKADTNSPYFRDENYWNGLHRHGLNGFLEKYPKDIIEEFLENGSIKQEWLRFFDNTDYYYSAVASAVHNRDLDVLDVLLDRGAECSPDDKGLMDSLFDHYLFDFIEENLDAIGGRTGTKGEIHSPEKLEVLERLIRRGENFEIAPNQHLTPDDVDGVYNFLVCLSNYIKTLPPRSLYDLSLNSIYSYRVDISELPPMLVQPFKFDLIDLYSYLSNCSDLDVL